MCHSNNDVTTPGRARGMRRPQRFLVGLLLALSVSAPAQSADELSQAVERLLAGEGESKGAIACDVLSSGALEDAFGPEAAGASLRPGSKYVPHALCTATWDKPDAEALQTAYAEYEMKKMMAKATKQPFDEPQPPPPGFTVSLTLIDEAFDSPEAAVASLESAVEQLTEGVTVTVQGKEHTTRVEFGDWIEDLGDLAVWAAGPGELQVAHAGSRFAVGVSGNAENDQDYIQAVALARRLMAGD